MSKSDDKEAIAKVPQSYKSILIKSLFCSFIGNLLFVAIALYSCQVMDRVIGSGSLDTSRFLKILVAVLVCSSFFCMLLSEILSNMIIKKEVSNYYMFIPVSIMSEAVCSLLYIILLFLVHPMLAVTAICGALFVMGYAYIKRVTANKSIREATVFDTIKSKWYYPIQHVLTLTTICLINNLALQLVCAILYTYFQYHFLMKSISSSNKNYKISKSSRFYIFLKELFSISIKILIYMVFTGIASYIIIATKAAELSTGGMILGSIFTARLLISADNFITIAPKISENLYDHRSMPVKEQKNLT